MNNIISVAMTTYNGEKHLDEQLKSFLKQIRLPDELIVCDDKSNDLTLEILRRFKAKAPFNVKIYQNEVNLGFTENFEKSISKCSGDLILLADQDDVWFDNKISEIEKAFHADTRKLLIISDGNLVDEKLKWYGVTALSQVQAGYGSTDALVVGALTAMRKEFVQFALPIPKGILGHDVWLHNIAQKIGTRKVINQSLQMIRRHSTNTSNWVASSVNKINRLEVFKSQLKTTVSNGYEDRIWINRSTTERLSKIKLEVSEISKKEIEKNQAYLTLELQALEYRNRIPNAKFIERKKLAIIMVIKGYYRFFNGYKSFMRDVMR